MPLPSPVEGSLSELGEDAIIGRLIENLRTGEDVLVGPGDDCAVIRQSGREHLLLLLKTDCVIEGVHFSPEAEPEAVGWKAAARVVSDFAAMGGGLPRHALVTLVAPGDRSLDWVKGAYAGIERCGREFHFVVAGGETSRPPRDARLALISIAMTGEISPERCILRSGAQDGDAIYVTGTLGGSLAGKHLEFAPRLAEARWLSKGFAPQLHAMMDVSDGLAKDLPRLARASHAGFQLNTEDLPVSPGCSTTQALTEGEDFELLFTLAAETRNLLEQGWSKTFPELQLTRIGRIVSAENSQELKGGWDHFG